MMMRSLLLKTLYDRRWFILGWSLGMAVLCWLTILFYPSFAKTDTIGQLTKTLPKELGALKGLLGDQETMRTVGGYIATQLYDIRLSLFLMISSLMLALSLGSSEEDRGRLRTLLATPLSRGRIMFEHWLSGVIILGILVLGSVVGCVIGIVAIGDTVPFKLLLQLSAMLWIFGVAMFSIIYGLGIGTGKRAIALTAGVVVTAGGFLLTTFATAVEWLQKYEVLSLLYYFKPRVIFTDGINYWHVLVLATLTLVFMCLGLLTFRSRDVSGD